MSSVIGEGMSMEQAWNDTDSGRQKYPQRTARPCATTSTSQHCTKHTPGNRHHHHLALQPFVGFRLLSQVSPNSSILSCLFPIFDFQLF